MDNRENIIVSADDFGISAEANKNILDLAKSGKIDRVSVMVFGKFTQEEVEELKNSGVKIDLHLNLNEEMGEKRRKKGVFERTFVFLIKVVFGVNSKEKVEKRWREEFEKFKEIFEEKPNGINSHEYVHFFPAYFGIALSLAKENNINFLRFGKNKLNGMGMISNILQRLRQKNYIPFVSSGLDTSDFLASFDWLENPKSFIKSFSKGDLELILHPEREEEYNFIKREF